MTYTANTYTNKTTRQNRQNPKPSTLTNDSKFPQTGVLSILSFCLAYRSAWARPLAKHPTPRPASGPFGGVSSEGSFMRVNALVTGLTVR